MNLIEKAMGEDPANITNRVIIFLFIKNLYDHDIQKCRAGAKTINTLSDAFRLAQTKSTQIKKNTKVICTMRIMKCQKYNLQTYTHKHS